MNNGKQQIMKSFRMEMVGSGLYRSLSSQYRNSEPKLSEKFSTFAGHEYMHGRLFGKHFRKIYGESLPGENFWIFMGRVMAFMTRPMSLMTKMRKLRAIETRAVADIERSLAGPGDEGMHEILRTILPDEKSHADLYLEVFPLREKHKASQGEIQ